MVNLKELLAFFEETAPRALAEDYDNVGLLVQGDTEIVETVFVALDVDERVVCEAAEAKAQLILSHHPLMFRPVKRLTEEEGGERALRRLIQKGIGLFAMHTNFDAAQNGLCDAFLHAFGDFENCTSFTGGKEGIGRIGTLKEPVALGELLKRGKAYFSPETPIQYVGDADALVTRLAVCNGGGADLLYEAKALGADVYISGDFKHHHARFAYENNIHVIKIDHYDAEVGFCALMAERLQTVFGDSLQVVSSKAEKSPWRSF